jgi:MFS superfamily sulfate permease-like transporter
VSPTGNELAGATSPYLRQHADNPVHWKQWGPEALAEAARRDVPILLSVGYKLSSWKIIRSVWKEGWSQFLPFGITVAGIVFIDLLKGILIGLCVSVVFLMRAYTRTAVTMVREGEGFLIRLNKDLTFINKRELKARLREVPDGARLIIDGKGAHSIDPDAVEVIRDFCEAAPHRGIQTQCRSVQGIRYEFREE